ncbi:MAG TPA: ATP-binding protein [Pedobacter sp.]|jgi:PAS domain S-box-containing protein
MDAESLKLENTALKKEIEALKATAVQDVREFDETNLWFKKVFESSLLGNKIISSDLKIIQANQALADLLGYENTEDIIGSRVTDYTPSECLQEWKELQKNLWNQSTGSFTLETCLVKRDGNLFWAQITSILFKIKGETFGFSIIQDCTDRHNLHRQKEEFINVASHELKTPITSLKAKLQIINRTLSADNSINPSLLKMFQDAEKHSTKLGHLVTDLLNLTRLEREEFPLNKARFVIYDLIGGCCSHIELHGDYCIIFEGDKSLALEADQIKIEQILINLVNNAVKYAPASKEIVIKAEKLDGLVKVSVSDQGEGISPEHLKNIFTRYHRAEKDHFKTSGLGIGLYISSEIIKRHGGDMSAENNADGGSTFWFTLPGE